MRTWHRWISLFFVLPMLFIAVTGLASHWAVLWPAGESAAAAPPVVAAAEFQCPEGWRCRPAPPASGPRAWTGFFHHLHSGEEFGAIGTAVSILSGVALLFFSVSGMVMYARMWGERRRRRARDRWFWR